MGAESPWFVASGSYGFTDNPDKAKKDRSGAPIIAQYIVHQMVEKTTERELENKTGLIWDYLYEVQDELDGYTGRPESMPHEARRKRARLAGEKRALIRVLSIYQFGDHNQEHVAEILQQLKEAYEEEA